MTSVSFIGPGRVGGALAIGLSRNGYRVGHLVTRDGGSASEISKLIAETPETIDISRADELTEDVIFITTQDPFIKDAAKSLSLKLKGKPIVFHTSGSYPSTILEILKDIGCETGSIHPLVSISDSQLGPSRFPGSYFCVEGTEAAVEMGLQMVKDLGGNPVSIDTKYKTLYHAAAVTACGHFVALFDSAVEMMSKCGLSSDEAKKILMPLVTSTTQNLSEQSTAAALTGTFARADIETFTRHLTSLNQYVSEDLLEIYLLLGERSLELAAKQGVSPEKIDSLRTKVSIAKSKLKW